jgi:hypothetical protein
MNAMKKLLGIGLVSLVAFGAALGAGWWMNQPAEESGHGESVAENSHESQHDESAAAEAVDSHVSHDAHDSHEFEGDVPLPVRPRPITTEQIFEIAMNLQEREAAVAQREEYVATSENHVAFIYADLEREQEEIEGLRAEVRSLLQSSQDLIQELRAAQEGLTQQKAEIEGLLAQVDESDAAQVVTNQQNIQRIADILKGMEPSKAAELLSSMASGESGDIDFVIQVFAELEDRDSAAIAEQITDTTIFTQIITGLRDYDDPAAQAPAIR